MNQLTKKRVMLIVYVSYKQTLLLLFEVNFPTYR